MVYFEQLHSYDQQIGQEQISLKDSGVTQQYCIEQFLTITSLYEEANGDEDLISDVARLALAFKQALRKDSKRRRRSSQFNEEMLNNPERFQESEDL